MRLIGTVSVGAFVLVAYFAASHFDHAAATTSIAVVTKPSTGASLMTEVKCVKVDGELKCGKKKHHSDDDDDHHGKDKDNGDQDRQAHQAAGYVPRLHARQRWRRLHIAVDQPLRQAEGRRPGVLLLQGGHFSADSIKVREYRLVGPSSCLADDCPTARFYECLWETRGNCATQMNSG